MTPRDLTSTHFREVEHIMKEMNSESSIRRAKAIEKLGQMDLSIYDISVNLHSKLEEALFDTDSNVRKEAAMTLAFIEGEVAIPLLEPLLNDPNQSVQSKVIAAISFIGIRPSESAVKNLIEFLNDPNHELRDRSARALGRLKVFHSKTKLLELAKSDKSPLVRTGALVGLGLLNDNDPELQSKIHQLLTSETSNLVISAIKETLAIMKKSPPISSILEKKTK
ncbi:MAG: HEAT repeat domain-containing protein [Candidatus Hodarchaeota archaeon]